MSPGRADRRVVDRHLSALRAAVEALRRHRRAGVETLRADPDLRWAVERGLQIAAQNALDIASHLVAAAGRDPGGYAAAIDGLAQAGALPPAFAARFRAVAGFRNVLVHGYLDVDVELVADALAGRLDDFEEFARHVELWLAASPDA